MMDANSPCKIRLAAFLAIAMLALGTAGCGGSDGDTGPAGAAGADGVDGTDGSDGNNGINCWDLNENGVPDFPDEDLNGDGVVDVLDCNANVGDDVGVIEQFHSDYFAENSYSGTGDCLRCHGAIADEILTTGHWNWDGISAGIEGKEGEIHGKTDIINNFCIAISTNEPRCTQCHIGYGYEDKNFDFSNREAIDCLVCHDQTGTYVKDKKTAGRPPPTLDLNPIAQSVAMADGIPSRKNCLACHAKAGGGDNVKHGDLSTAMVATTRDYDVHMGTDGGNLQCVTCHEVQRDANDNLMSHGIGGMVVHSVDEGVMKDCTDCHGDQTNIHAGTSVENLLTPHGDRLACQVCHIPTFAREKPTKTFWDWSTAGQDIPPEEIPIDPDTGMPLYDKMKGTFEWANDVRPALLYYDHKWEKAIENADDVFTETPVSLGKPSADYTTAEAKIYPFKKMIGKQVADANNNTMLVPHLFGMKGGPNPYWVFYDWDLALQDGAAYTGQTYSGAYQFVETDMYLTVNHEVAPKEMAYGMDGDCLDCHRGDQIDWTALGWDADPFEGGTRP
ncbi:MAG: tetrathionate reductase family octaheme c-type cytochrome [Gammaproteobacteria bacterium]